MSCETIDLKAWILGEVDRQEKSRYEAHLDQCQPCSLEFKQLRLTHAALLTLPEEEMPSRIAFVSDRVFEPRWYQTIWRSGPAMGFASAAMLAGAILVHGFTQPRPLPVAQVAPVAHSISLSEVDQRVQTAVSKAVADIEVRERAEHQQILVSAERKSAVQGQALIAAQETIRLYQNQMGRMMVAANTSAITDARGAQ